MFVKTCLRLHGTLYIVPFLLYSFYGSPRDTVKNSSAVHRKLEYNQLDCSYRLGYMALRADEDRNYLGSRV